MRGLKGKITVVTGAASGIGRAIALRLGEEGARARSSSILTKLVRHVSPMRSRTPAAGPGEVSTGFLADQAETLTAPGEDVSGLLMAAAALSDGRLVDEVMQIPQMHRKMGGWTN